MSDRLVELLLAAREHHRPAAPPSETRALAPVDAYAVQDRLRESLVARGERVVGWKAGFTNKATQTMFATDAPVCAFLLASGVFPSRAEVPASRFVTLVVEAEVAFVMKADLAGPGVTPARALLAVAGALPALELVDFRYTGKPVATDLIADGVYANAIVVGAPMTDVSQMDLSVEGLVYELNGTVAATNAAAEVMGNPLNSLAWIANHLGARGLGLSAGDLVMSGSISQLLRPKSGDVVRATFTRLGSVGFRVV